MTSFAKVLARAVEKHPLLYSQAAQAVAKKEDYDEAWRAVAFDCDKPVAVIKSRWSKTIKSLMQDFTNPSPPTSKNQGRKTRSSDFQLLDELKFLLPFISNESPNTWGDEISETDATSTTASASSPDGSTTVSASSTDGSRDARDSRLEAKKQNATTTTATVGSINIGVNDKRKREQAKSIMTGAASIQSMGAERKKQQQDGSYFVTEPVDDNSSSIRLRRIVEDPAQSKQSTNAGTAATSSAPNDESTLKGSKKLLRNRSHSMYMERKELDDEHAKSNDSNDMNEDEDDDDDYKPPPSKKVALGKAEVKTPAVNSGRSRGRPRTVCTINLKKTINAAIKSPTTTTTTKTPETTSSSSSNYDLNNSSSKFEETPSMHLREFASGIDMTMIEAAAAAEAAVAHELLRESMPKCYRDGIDAETQCNYEADEEDDEFLARTRLWLQRMNPRQKLVFRKGVYQAYLDVYDDPRNFEIQKGADKFVITQLNGMPALFTGMSPIELRLVRQLAIAVAGSKLTPVTAPKFSNVQSDSKCKTPTSQQPAAGSGANGLMRPPSQQQQHQQQSQHQSATTSTMSSTPSPPATIARQSAEKPPAVNVLRTTAIALSNQVRSPSGVQRVLRKVVRVDNSNNEGGTQHNGGNYSGTSSNHNSHSLLRARTISVTSGNNNSNNSQRIYRILPNGNIMRHSQTVSNSSGTSSPTTAAYSQPLSSNNRLATTSTLTTSTGTVITTRNISRPNSSQSSSSGQTQILVDPKTGYRRQYVNAPDGGFVAVDNIEKKLTAARPPMSRRYSICSIPRELKQTTAPATASPPSKLLPVSSASGTATLSPSASTSSSSSAAAAPKPVVRVRYPQKLIPVPGGNTSSAVAAAAIRKSGTNHFALPNAISPRKQQQQQPRSRTNSPTQYETPVPVMISSSNVDNSDDILKRAQQVYENALLADEERALKNTTTSTAAPAAAATPAPADAVTDNREDDLNAEKSNCLITSDRIGDFVVKNEPLDLEDEDEMNDYMDD